MSTDWNLHCMDCKSTHTFNDANHMVDEMKSLIKHASAVAALAPLLDESRDIVLQLGQYNSYGLVDADWFVAHLGHKLRPINEYGGLLDECSERLKCEHCGIQSGRCGLDEGHAGQHQPRA